MARYICMNCGEFIVRRSNSDPYTCRECEKLFEGAALETRESYLENLM